MGEVTVLPKFEDVKSEMLPLRGFSQYLVHPQLGKVYNTQSGKWLLVDAKGVGDKGYLMTTLKHDSGENIHLYEHEAVYASVWGDEPKSWRSFENGDQLEIDHIDGNVKNNTIENLRLGTSEDNKKNRSYDMAQNNLTIEYAQFVRDEFNKWEGKKTDFYNLMAEKFNVCSRTIQNTVLGVTYNKPRLKYQVDKNGVVHNVQRD